MLSQAQYQELALFRFALRRFLSFSEVAAQKAGMTSQQYQALIVIRALPQRSVLVGTLASQMLLKHNNTVQLVDRLVKLRLVRRVPSSTDRRAVELRLTAKGEAKVARLAAIHYRELVERHALDAVLRMADRLPGPGFATTSDTV